MKRKGGAHQITYAEETNFVPQINYCTTQLHGSGMTNVFIIIIIIIIWQ
jgi:hypothetical protein